ncbi:MAG: SulP family inorganic anion transporter [Actinomycetes bacterium]
MNRFLPRKSDFELRSWRADLLAGIAVGVVALPLALAFGITTGLSAGAGLITAIIAGFIAGLFGGSRFQVSGPTGAMTVVLVPIVTQYGAGGVPIVGLIAGLLIILLGVFKLGRLISAIPWPVIEGFTVGIAIVISLQQIPLLLDVKKPAGSNAAQVAWHTLSVHGINSTAILLGLGSALLVVLLSTFGSKVPPSIIAVVAGTLVVQFAGLHVARIGALPRSLPLPHLPHLDPSVASDFFSAALAVTALGAIESLLSARVADGMADSSAKSDPDRELFGQGLGTVVASLMGGMPATGAIARTAVNVRSGARTRLASIFHSLFLLLVVLFLAPIVGRIPTSVLAGILIGTAYRMVDIGSVRSVLRSTRSDAAVFMVTAFVTVTLDLIVAVEVGLLLAGVMAIRHLVRSSSIVLEDITEHLNVNEGQELLHEHIVTYRLDGALFFGDAHLFLHHLTQISGVKVVVLRMGSLTSIDASGAQAVGEIIRELGKKKIDVFLQGVFPAQRQILERSSVLSAVTADHHIFEELSEALSHARAHVRRTLHSEK